MVSRASADPPHVAVVDVEGETHDAEQDAEAGEHGHGRKQLLRQEAVLLDHHGAVGRRPGAWRERGGERERERERGRESEGVRERERGRGREREV